VENEIRSNVLSSVTVAVIRAHLIYERTPLMNRKTPNAPPGGKFTENNKKKVRPFDRIENSAIYRNELN